MGATGNITEDLEAIRHLVLPGTYGFEVYERLGLVPWSPPVTEEALDVARNRIPGFPEDLAELFRVTGNIAAAVLEIRDGLEGLGVYRRSERIDQVGEPMQFRAGKNTSCDDDEGWVPDGDMINLGDDLYMATGGPHQGALYRVSFMWMQRSAWRLSDVVACTRELYENGWYSYLQMSGIDRKSHEIEGRINDLVLPVAERWHCSPTIALIGGHHVQPPRPQGF